MTKLESASSSRPSSPSYVIPGGLVVSLSRGPSHQLPQPGPTMAAKTQRAVPRHPKLGLPRPFNDKCTQTERQNQRRTTAFCSYNFLNYKTSHKFSIPSRDMAYDMPNKSSGFDNAKSHISHASPRLPTSPASLKAIVHLPHVLVIRLHELFVVAVLHVIYVIHFPPIPLLELHVL